MAIRLRKPDGSKPLPLSAALMVGDPPIYRETLRALMARDAFFLVDPRVEHRPWSALDHLLAEAAEQGAVV